MLSRSPSPPLRRSCSRNSGCPSDRLTQARANALLTSPYSPARASASCSRSGPRSIVISGAARVRLRHIGSSWSPSVREVITRTSGQSAVSIVSSAACARVMASAQCRSSIVIICGRRALSRRSSCVTVLCFPRLRAGLSMASYSARSSVGCGRSSRSFRYTSWSGSRSSSERTRFAAARAAVSPCPEHSRQLRTIARIAS